MLNNFEFKNNNIFIGVLNEVIQEYKNRGQEFDYMCCIYPTAPFVTAEKLELNFIKTMKKYNVTKCVYGHIHGENAQKEAIQGKVDGIEFKMLSSDYTKFDLIKID